MEESRDSTKHAHLQMNSSTCRDRGRKGVGIKRLRQRIIDRPSWERDTMMMQAKVFDSIEEGFQGIIVTMMRMMISRINMSKQVKVKSRRQNK
eukprot:768580-Hanusia_phi.AAC.1